jgi:hypothetical protein
VDARIICLVVLTFPIAQAAARSPSDPQASSRTKSQKEQSIREWSDASGTRTARATLLNVEGEKVSLRGEDGGLREVALSELSDADRQFVASQRRTLPSTSEAPSNSSPASSSVVSNVVDKLASGLPKLKDAVSLLSPVTPEAQDNTNPAGLLYVRMSRDFIDRHMQRSVDKQGPVRDLVLGTDIYGESNTTGETHIALLPSDGAIKAEIHFDGMVRARTTGYNGPAILHYVSDTPFHARKTITIDESGLSLSDAQISSTTNLQTTGIQTTLPRLRGRIASRIAARRNAGSHNQAEAITDRHTADRVRADFDRGANEKIAKLEDMLGPSLSRLTSVQDQPKPITRFRSNTDYAELAMIRSDARPKEWELKPPGIEGNPDVAIRVNRSLVGRVLADAELSRQWAPLIASFSNGALSSNASVIFASDKTPIGRPKVSIDGNWVSVDLSSEPPAATEDRVASRR